MNVESLVQHWSAKSSLEMKNLYSGMVYENKIKNPQASQEYKSKRLSDTEKRQWLARFALNPESGGAKASFISTYGTTDEEQVRPFSKMKTQCFEAEQARGITVLMREQ